MDSGVSIVSGTPLGLGSAGSGSSSELPYRKEPRPTSGGIQRQMLVASLAWIGVALRLGAKN